VHEQGLDERNPRHPEIIPFQEREFFLDVRAARELLEALLAAPLVAVAPDLSLAGFQEADARGELETRLRATSKAVFRSTSHALIRRHLFEGYQWKLKADKQWRGGERSAPDAISAATAAFESHGIESPMWMYLPIVQSGAGTTSGASRSL
jgi:hypothetical protein